MSTAQVITGIVLLLVWTLTAIPRAEGNSIQSIQSKSDASLIQDAFAVTQNQVSETQNYHAKQEAQHALDALYKGDYRQAFLEKKPELFLKHIAPNFHSTLIDGTVYDAKALQQFFPKQFANMIQTHEHDVTIEDVDVATNGAINAVVTLNTLIEYKSAAGRSYFVINIGTYRDRFVRSLNGVLLETGGNQLRLQTITWPKP
jgi:hypothetical protein